MLRGRRRSLPWNPRGTRGGIPRARLQRRALQPPLPECRSGENFSVWGRNFCCRGRAASTSSVASNCMSGYRLSCGIGVQRGRVDFSGLGVGRGFVQRLFLLRRRLFEGGHFQFGVQGCALGFGIEDVCHHCCSRTPCTGRLLVFAGTPARVRRCRWGQTPYLSCNVHYGALSGNDDRTGVAGRLLYSSPLGNTRQATAGWRAAAALCWNPRRKLRFQVYQPSD